MTLRKNHNTIPEALKRQVDGLACDHQAMDRELVDADRQLRSLDVDLATPTVNSRPRQACKIMKGAPAAQACGRQATG